MAKRFESIVVIFINRHSQQERMKWMQPDIFKVRTVDQLYTLLPEDQLILTDLLRGIIMDLSNGYLREKISYQVPYFFNKKGIAIVWPATIPRGGIKSGVLFGIWYGNRLSSLQNYLIKGENKQIFYKVIHAVKEVNEKAIKKLIKEAIEIDKSWK